jgi:hypothetical protein
MAPASTVFLLHLGAEKWRWASESASDVPNCERYATLPWHQAIESVSDMPSCEFYAARQADIIM